MFQDVRYAIRSLRKSPGFTIVALLTLALGIGATSAIFAVVNSVLLRPLPFPEPARLFLIANYDLRFSTKTEIDVLAYQSQSQLFEHIAAYTGDRVTMLGAGEPVSVRSQRATGSFWPLLGVQPALGRAFRDGDDDVVVLSDGLWRTRFGANRAVLGKSIQLDGKTFTILGVMPPRFDYPESTELWTLLQLRPKAGDAYLWTIGRTKRGVSSQPAQQEIDAIAQRTAGRGPRSAHLLPLQEFIVGDVSKSLWMFLGAVGLLLSIACVNVANLLVARGIRRTDEFATRAALGASRSRIVRQIVTENVLLSLAGGALGLLVAAWGETALILLAPANSMPRLGEVRIDGWVLGFTMLVSLGTGVLFGLAPAIRVAKIGLSEAMKRGATRLAGARIRGALVTIEIALSLVLLAGAGLLIRSFLHLRSVPTGFETQHLLTMSLSLPPDLYRTPAQLNNFHADLLSRIAPLPGVKSVGAVNWLPFGDSLISGTFSVTDRPASATKFSVSKPGVSPDYFNAMGIHLVRGRFFAAQDDQQAPRVAIVGDAMARRVWPGEDPIGKRITLEDKPKPEDWLTVVGVVEDVKQRDLSKKAPPAIYQPLPQIKRPFFLSWMTYAVRTSGDPRQVANLVRSRLHEVDPNQPVENMATMEELLDVATAAPQFRSRILGAFAAVSLLLAMVGIHGVMAYAVAGRTREIGIRVALGATRSDVLRLVLSDSAVLIAAGVTLGLAGAFAATRVLRDFLFEVQPRDPATLATVAALLAAVALAAAFLPARAAAKIDPVTALRNE